MQKVSSTLLHRNKWIMIRLPSQGNVLSPLKLVHQANTLQLSRVDTIGKFTTSLESKRGKLEHHNVTATLPPVETRKTFAFDEIVTDSKHFYIDPSETNAKMLIPRILQGENLAVVSPYQTGKTTMARKLVLQLKDLGLLPILFVNFIFSVAIVYTLS